MIAEYDISLGRIRARDAQKGSRARQNNPRLVKFAGLCQPRSIPNAAHVDIVTDGEAKPRALSSRIGRETRYKGRALLRPTGGKGRSASAFIVRRCHGFAC